MMNRQERQRKAVLEMVRQRRISLVQASQQCELSYRQTLRIYQRYEEKGDAGLIHGNRGRVSSRKNPHQASIINRYIERYEDFGPTLASEYLERDGFHVDHETLRKWLIKEGLWKKQRKRSPYRRKRERKAQFGELIQMDGSIHDWLGTGKHHCLLNMVDDATSTSLSTLASGETTRVVFECFKKWLEKYGIPLAIYVDLKNVYVSNKRHLGFCHFEVACNKLGVRIIKAYSPQAKGRVERNHAVYQDRFVKELRLENIHTLDEANKVLENGFIDHLNEKFSRPAQNQESAHRPLGKTDLNQILCWEYQRQIQHDWTFYFQGTLYQVKKHQGDWIKPKVSVLVRKHLDGSVSAWYDDKRLSLEVPDKKPEKVKKPYQRKVYNNIKPISWKQTNSYLYR
ncbi:ISNCY family transposase [Legionella pneumophila serogroup 1]